MVDLLVLTSCVAPPSQEMLKLTDKGERYKQTIDCLRYYFENQIVTKVIICDGSNYNFGG